MLYYLQLNYNTMSKKTLLSASFVFMLLLAPIVQAQEEIIYDTPISYDHWMVEFFFFGGFEGFVDFLSYLTPENRASYIEEGDFSSKGNFKDQSINEWLRNNRLDGKGRFKYRVNG